MSVAKHKAQFFDSMRATGMKLTFDDVRLETGPSDVSPREVDITSQFSRNISLKTPFVSAIMDTVTTSRMAIAMAQLGGIGVIHAGFSPEQQRSEVRRVKLHLNGLIEKPVCVQATDTLGEILAMCEQKRFEFHTFPVLDGSGVFVGLLSENDFAFCPDRSATAAQAMTERAKLTVAEGKVSLSAAYKKMTAEKKKTLPVLSKTGAISGLYIYSDVSRIVNDNNGLYNVDSDGRLRVAAAVPTNDQEALQRVTGMRKYLDAVVIDTAQGDSKYARQTLKALKTTFPDLDVVVGNISSAKSAKMLAAEGADGIKVGQGPGSICTTRIETGIGSPQVSAVYECARAVEGSGVPICADGGIKERGDISIAIAAGAESVMMGSMLAGTKEAPGEVIRLEDGRPVKLYRGMGSASAMRDNASSRKRYSTEGIEKPLAEGVESHVPYKGSVSEVIHYCEQSLRRSMSYVGAPTITAHRENTNIFQITNSGLRESRPHDVSVIRR